MISFVLEIVSKYILSIIESAGYFGVFILMALESANIPIPSEIIMPFAGFLASGGTLNFWLIVFFILARLSSTQGYLKMEQS